MMVMNEFLKQIGAQHKFPLVQLKWFVEAGDKTAARLNKETGEHFRRDYGRGMLLYSMVKHFKPVRVFEIGMGRGYSGICMVKALRELGNPAHHFCTVDPQSPDLEFPNTVYPKAVETATVRGLMEQFLGDIADVNIITGRSSEVIPQCMSRALHTFDFAFIDGSHRLDDVVKDTKLVMKHIMAPGGILVFHDFKCLKAKQVEPALNLCVEKGYFEGYDLFEVLTDGDFNAELTKYRHNELMGSLVAIPKAGAHV
jgi:predicted O-methyltransferase YrrM